MLATSVLQPPTQLSLDRPSAPEHLVLETAERLELAMRGNDLLHAIGAERPDQLVFEVLDADVRRVAEDAPEPALLSGVAQADEALARTLRGGASDRLRTADRHDVDAFGDEVAAELRRDRLERDPIGDPFDEDDRAHAATLA